VKIAKYLFILNTIFFLFSCGTDKKEEAIKFFKRGNYKLKDKEYQEAIHWFDESIIQNPDFADAYNNRGLAKVLGSLL
jgi:tetratricopeptide (TPR) repeat protein